MRQTIYYNGPILTMRPGPMPDAVLTEGGRIVAVGGLEEVLSAAGPNAEHFDLEGHTLMPAFIDPHSHLSSLAGTIRMVALDGADSFAEIQRRIRDHIERNHIPPHEAVTGFGYDNNALAERAHPTRQLLDEAGGGRPVVIATASLHMGVASSAALAAFGIDRNTPDPAGGRIGRDEAGEPTGYLEEAAFVGAMMKSPPPDAEAVAGQFLEAEKIYLQNGITTVQDGFTEAGQWKIMKAIAQAGRFTVDVVCYPGLEKYAQIARENPEEVQGYRGRLRIGGYKIILDGSPQGRTAWMREPYLGPDPDYRGYPIYTDEQVEGFIETAVAQKMQLLAHCNGDAAAEQFLKLYTKVSQRRPEAKELRPVMIHAQLATPEQIARMAPLGMVASFFVAHTYYWGDVHLKNFGPARGGAISAVRSAIENHVPYTFHQDTPVLPPNMLDTVWCAVHRITKNGAVLDQNQRVTVYEALQGVTTWAAYQYGEEQVKGSIAPGMQADLVVLSENPLADPERLREIRVLHTIKEGKLAYSRPDAL